MSIQNITGRTEIRIDNTEARENSKKKTLQKEEKNKSLKCCYGDGAKMRQIELGDSKGIELIGLGGQIECRS